MLRCARCGAFSLRIDRGNSEYFDSENPAISTEYYPPKIFRPKPTWLASREGVMNCPFEVHDLFDEFYICLHNNCPRAAAMASRALLECIFVATCTDHGNFSQNLEAFHAAGHLSKFDRDQIETVFEAGHATIHRSFKPSKDDLTAIADIIETVAAKLYVHSARVEKLKERVPPRQTKKPRRPPPTKPIP